MDPLAQREAWSNITITCDWCGKPKSLLWLVLLQGGMLCGRCVHEAPPEEVARIALGIGCDS